MRKFQFLSLLALASGCAQAAISFSTTGTFVDGDEIATYLLVLAGNDTVTLRTFGYAGGTNGVPTIIPDGGFDPFVALFDSSGSFIGSNDDGGCGNVGTDPNTLSCLDSLYINNLAAGNYYITLSQSGNFPGLNIADPFSQAGNLTYSCDAWAISSTFCDSNLTIRNGNWALDVSLTGDAWLYEVPEPSMLALSTLGLAAISVARRLVRAKQN